jgi:hypothetical protein
MAEQMSSQGGSEMVEPESQTPLTNIEAMIGSEESVNLANSNANKRKNTSFKITNILPSRPPSNDPDESGDDDPDDSHTEDISEHFEHVINAANVTARGRFNILPCPQDEISAVSTVSSSIISNVISASSTSAGAPPSSSRNTSSLADDQK